MPEVRTFTDTLSWQRLGPTDEREPSDPWKKAGSQLETVFGDLVSDLDLLKSLYEPARVREWDNEFVLANLFTLPPTRVEDLLHEGMEVDLNAFLQTASCIYLIAPIGRGKTTYIHYKLRVEAPKQLAPLRLIPIIFDVQQCTSADEFVSLFAKQLDDEIDQAFPFFSMETDEKADTVVHRALCEAFEAQLRKAGLPTIYRPKDEDPELHQKQKDEFARLRREDTIGFNTIRIRYARRKDSKSFIVIAIDNVDQHLLFPHGEEIVKDSHALAKRLGCPLILSLRDTSFRKNNPAFIPASYNTRHLALSSGMAQPMLSRRLETTSSLVSEDPTLLKFIEALASQLGVQDSERKNRLSRLVDDWIEPISNRNRREMLDVMKSVISSLHLTSQTFERNRTLKNDYLNTDFEIAVAKVKMAILLGRHPYYSDDSYHMCALNLFRDNRPDVACHNLIRLKILQHLYERRTEGSIVQEVLDRCISVLGDYALEIVRQTVVRLLEKGLVVALDESVDFRRALQRLPIDLDKLLDNRMHITLNGVFHHNTLLRDDIYLDEMKYATPLPVDVHEDVFQHYKKGWPGHRPLRQQSTKRFIEYLISCEEHETTQGLSAALDVANIMQGSYDAYSAAIQAMNRHDLRKLEDKRHHPGGKS